MICLGQSCACILHLHVLLCLSLMADIYMHAEVVVPKTVLYPDRKEHVKAGRFLKQYYS